jgi:hypothetical protein
VAEDVFINGISNKEVQPCAKLVKFNTLLVENKGIVFKETQFKNILFISVAKEVFNNGTDTID